jgi:hypothetical protein
VLATSSKLGDVTGLAVVVRGERSEEELDRDAGARRTPAR